MALTSAAMIAERITQLVAECDNIVPPDGLSGTDLQAWTEYRHACKQQLILAAGVAKQLDVGERTGRFTHQGAYGNVDELVAVGGGGGGQTSGIGQTG